jgi:hypothetical protein
LRSELHNEIRNLASWLDDNDLNSTDEYENII